MPARSSILAVLLLICLARSSAAGSDPSCSQIVNDFKRDYGKHVVPTNLSEAFYFFLHVPRTAGKTYSQCFLRAAVKPSLRCSPSYDFLRLNISQPGCRYITSHDDYSLMDQLPENSAVITQLRNPVNRVVSAYEFAIEVAARRIHLDDNDFARQQANTSFVNTLNVWPWSHLVPFFREDMLMRKERLRQEIAEKGIQRTWEEHFDKRYNRTYYFNRATQESVWEIPTSNTTLDPYDNDLVMPLREWIEHPTAQEFIHDASALQLLGITNNSFWPTAPAVRRCYFEDDAARAELMALAKERLEIVHHVGLTEKLEDSVASLAASMGVSLGNGTAYKSVPKGALAYDAPGFDDSALVKYNKTVVDPAGEEVELSILEARRTLVNLMQNATGLHTKLNDLEPKLEDLVTQEEAWLDEQDAKYAATLRGRIEAQWRWVKEWVRNVTGIAAGEDGSEIQEVDDEGPEEVIDSPWADQIVELDAQVYELQQKLQRVEADMESLRAIPEVKGPEEPAGPAKFIMGDEEYKETLKVGRYYLKCAKEATNRAKNKRTKAFKHLRNLNEESFMFTSEARQAVYKTDIADRIRELNPADDAMFWRGQELLASSIERQKAAGTYEEMIKWPPKPPTPPPEVVGEEAVEGDEDAAELAEAAEDASSAGSAEDANKAVSETDPPSEDFSEEENMHSEL